MPARESRHAYCELRRGKNPRQFSCSVRGRDNFYMKQFKGTHLALIALVCALAGGGAAALWMKHKNKDEAKALLSAARVERVDGEVGIGRGTTGDVDNQHWLEA